MFSQYFGQYLLNKKILTPEQLSDALAFERSVHVRLGVLAINSGLMSAVQVEEVHDLQRSKDKRFGEIAVEKGYLTVSQLEDLLQIQGSRQLSLSQAVVDRGYLSLSDLEVALDSYKKDNKLSPDQWEALQTVDYDQAAHIFLDFSQEGGRAELYYSYISLILRNMVRFLNDIPILAANVSFDGKARGWVVRQNIVGEVDLVTALVADDAVLIELAARYSQEELNAVDELSKDSVAEFLNLANGLFCVNASDKGLDLNLEPQTISHNEHLPVTGHVIPITLSFGKILLIIGSK